MSLEKWVWWHKSSKQLFSRQRARVPAATAITLLVVLALVSVSLWGFAIKDGALVSVSLWGFAIKDGRAGQHRFPRTGKR